MLDGKYNAANLPNIKGRAILRINGEMREIQTPFISDMTIRETVSAIKTGEYTAVPTRTVAPDIIFKYALTDLMGECAVAELFKKFKNDGVPQSEMKSILKDYEVRGTPPNLEPEIEIDGDVYYLAPSIPGSRRPRKLIKVYEFEREFEAKWASIVCHQSQVNDLPEAVTIPEEKISKVLETEQTLEEVF
jgi:hypothetical protein